MDATEVRCGICSTTFPGPPDHVDGPAAVPICCICVSTHGDTCDHLLILADGDAAVLEALMHAAA